MLTWDICQSVFTEYDEDGFLILTHDAYGEKNSGVHGGEVHWQGGSWYRPRDPDTDNDGNPTKGCTVFQIWEGSQNHIKLSSDPRAVPKLPRARKGGSGVYADTGKAQLPYLSFDGDDGSMILYVPYAFTGTPPNDTPSKAMAISIDVTSGQPSFQIVHGEGCAISLQSDGSVSIVASDLGASLTVSKAGKITINGNVTVQGAMLMGDPTAAVPLTLQPALVALLGALEAAIATGLSSVGVGTAAAGPAGAAAFASQYSSTVAPLIPALASTLAKAL